MRRIQNDHEQVERIARTIMRKHLNAHWSFGFDDAVVRLGCCYHSRQRITLSRRLTADIDYDVLTNTVLHEVAHALAGPSHGHDAAWATIHRSIGGDGKRCYSKGDVVRVPPKFMGICRACGDVHPAHRRTKGAACPKCCDRYNGGAWSDRFLLRWTRNPAHTAACSAEPVAA